MSTQASGNVCRGARQRAVGSIADNGIELIIMQSKEGTNWTNIYKEDRPRCLLGSIRRWYVAEMHRSKTKLADLAMSFRVP